jgi:hypothetical protein
MNIKTLSTLCVSVLQDDWGLLTSWGTNWNTPFQFCFCTVGSGHCCCFVITHCFGRFLVPKWLSRCELISKLMDYYCAWKNFTGTFFLTLSIRVACTVHNPPPKKDCSTVYWTICAHNKNQYLTHCMVTYPVVRIIVGKFAFNTTHNNCQYFNTMVDTVALLCE